MIEYEVVIDSGKEQYRYLIEADNEDQARDQGLEAAREDGYGGAGMWVEVKEQ